MSAWCESSSSWNAAKADSPKRILVSRRSVEDAAMIATCRTASRRIRAGTRCQSVSSMGSTLQPLVNHVANLSLRRPSVVHPRTQASRRAMHPPDVVRSAHCLDEVILFVLVHTAQERRRFLTKRSIVARDERDSES